MSKYQYREYEYSNSERSSQRPLKGGDSNFAQTGIPGEAIVCTPLQAVNYDNNFERMFKTFRAMVQKEKIVSQIKENRAFEKPSDKKRRRVKEAARKRFEDEAFERRMKSREKAKEKPE